jgi:hypothetical protein
MKMKFGALVVAGRGKIGGHVASQNRGGAYLRTKVTPVNPQSSAQLNVRSRLTGFSQAWSELDEVERLAWNAAVGDFARTDIFGDLRNPSGFNLYQRLNNNLAIVGQAPLRYPPLPSAVGSCFATKLTFALGELSVVVTLSNTVPSDTAVQVWATPPVSAGKSFVKSQYRLITVLDAAATSPADISEAYVVKFGDGAQEGQKVFVKTVAVNTSTGQVSTPSQVSAIVETL